MRLMKILKKIGAVLLCLVFTAASAGLLGLLFTFGSGQTAQAGTADAGLSERFGKAIHNRLADAMEGIASVKKTYWIAADAPAAPEPDPSCYGSAEDPQNMQEVLDRAGDVLEGQQTFFGTDHTLLSGTHIEYYLDETLLAICWKEKINDMAVTFAEVKMMDFSQFRRYLAGDSFGSGKLMLTSEMAQTVNAVVACSADYYGYRPDGTVVIEGKALRASRSLPDQCYFDYDGDMHLTRNESFGDLDSLQAFVDENNIRYSLSFGPILVKDGEVCPITKYLIGETDEHYVRAGIGQLDRLHYLFIACNQEGEGYYTPNIQQFAELFASTGCANAYNLDGGQTATVVMNNEVFNQVNYGSERRISDILYFATAKPRGE